MSYKNTEIAWLAGLLEGEGSFITATKKHPVCLSINMTDEDVIRRVAEMWEVAVSCPKKQAPHHRQSFRCMVRGGRAVRWIDLVLPYLGKRRTGQALGAKASHKPRGPKRKVSKEQAGAILLRFRRGERATDLAEEFGVTKWAVYAIHQGRVNVGQVPKRS